MAWSRIKTIFILRSLFLLSLCFAALSIKYILILLLKHDAYDHIKGSFIYLIAATFGSGLGCISSRICQNMYTLCHAGIHSIVLASMFFGHREIFQLLSEGQLAKCYNEYPLSMFTIGAYTLQYIIAFPCFGCKYGERPIKNNFRTGIHSFMGTLIFFICIADGIIVGHKISYDEKLRREPNFHKANICIFAYGVCIWYLLLNPYFDWRRINKSVIYFLLRIFLFALHLIKQKQTVQ